MSVQGTFITITAKEDRFTPDDFCEAGTSAGAGTPWGDPNTINICDLEIPGCDPDLRIVRSAVSFRGDCGDTSANGLRTGEYPESIYGYPDYGVPINTKTPNAVLAIAITLNKYDRERKTLSPPVPFTTLVELSVTLGHVEVPTNIHTMMNEWVTPTN